MQLTDPAVWRCTVEVNLLGAYNTVRAALPAVVAQRGCVAVTASLASFAHAPYMSGYCATKAGVEAMADSLRIEVAHHGVEVTTIHPTWIDTDMVCEADDLPSFQLLRRALRPPFKKTYPVERAVTDIVAGFERRRRRICVPRFVYVAHALRPLLTTRLMERDSSRSLPSWSARFAGSWPSGGRRAPRSVSARPSSCRRRTAAPANEPAQV